MAGNPDLPSEVITRIKEIVQIAVGLITLAR